MIALGAPQGKYAVYVKNEKYEARNPIFEFRIYYPGTALCLRCNVSVTPGKISPRADDKGGFP
jgi:hypothetical protein